MKEILGGFMILLISFSVGMMDSNIGVWGWVGVPIGGFFVIRGIKNLKISRSRYQNTTLQN